MTTTPLHEQHCVPCEGGVPALQREEALALAAEANNWTLAADVKSISREFQFKDFKESLAFIDQVGALAESEGHHPDARRRPSRRSRYGTGYDSRCFGRNRGIACSLSKEETG